MQAEQSKEGRYWDEKSLDELTQAQWESLCDGCGLCCLVKLQDEDTDELVYTCVVCRYSDTQTGACTDYANRSVNVPTCVPLTRERVAEFDWLPDSCAYRMRHNGQKLADWHPLNTGRRESVKEAGVGIAAIPVVVDYAEIDYEDYVIDKPEC